MGNGLGSSRCATGPGRRVAHPVPGTRVGVGRNAGERRAELQAYALRRAARMDRPPATAAHHRVVETLRLSWVAGEGSAGRDRTRIGRTGRVVAAAAGGHQLPRGLIALRQEAGVPRTAEAELACGAWSAAREVANRRPIATAASRQDGQRSRKKCKRDSSHRRCSSPFHSTDSMSLGGGRRARNRSFGAGQGRVPPPHRRQSLAPLPVSGSSAVFLWPPSLLGFELPPWRRKGKRRLVETAKFCLFDVGLANHLHPELRMVVEGTDAHGRAFEHFLINEVRACLSYGGRDDPLSLWRTSTGFEVDLIVGDMVETISRSAGFGSRSPPPVVSPRVAYGPESARPSASTAPAQHPAADPGNSTTVFSVPRPRRSAGSAGRGSASSPARRRAICCAGRRR
jgi:hypothetical protein